MLGNALSVAVVTAQNQLKFFFFYLFLQLIYLMEVGQLVFIVSHHANLIYRSERRKKSLEVVFVDIILRKSNYLHTKFFRFYVLHVFLLGSNSPEKMNFPDEVEEEQS